VENTAKEIFFDLRLANKALTIFRWVLEIATAMYILFIVWAVQPEWQMIEGVRRRFVDSFLEHFPFDDIQLTWIMIVVFGALIVIKVLLFKKEDFYKSTFKFGKDIFTMIIWIIISIAWLVITAMGVVGEVFYWFGWIPEYWIDILNYMF